VLLDPFGQGFPFQIACRELEHQVFLFIYLSTQFVAVQHQEHFHGRMSDSFVSIDEWVIEDQRKTQGRSFGGEVWIEVGPTEPLSGLYER